MWPGYANIPELSLDESDWVPDKWVLVWVDGFDKIQHLERMHIKDVNGREIYTLPDGR